MSPPPSGQFAFRDDMPLVRLEVAEEWVRPEQAVVRYRVETVFARSSWDWIGLYRVRRARWSVTWGKEGPAGERLGTQVGSWLLQSLMPPREAAGVRPEGSEPRFLSPQVGFRHCKDYVAYVWAKHEDVDRNNYQVLKGSGGRGGSPHGLLGEGGVLWRPL